MNGTPHSEIVAFQQDDLEALGLDDLKRKAVKLGLQFREIKGKNEEQLREVIRAFVAQVFRRKHHVADCRLS